MSNAISSALVKTFLIRNIARISVFVSFAQSCKSCHYAKNTKCQSFSILLSQFQAEEVNIKNNIYHKRCLSCKNCKRNLDISILAIGPDDDIYCSICCHKISWPNRYQGACDTSVIPGEEGEPTNCPRCHGKVCSFKSSNGIKAWAKPMEMVPFFCLVIFSFALQVFEAERMSTKKALYHKKCFTCIKCKSALDYFSAIEGPDDEVGIFSA